MDAIVWLAIGLASVWFGYAVTAAERRTHSWTSSGVLGVYLAVFGGVMFGLGTLWDRFLRAKLTDDFPGESTLLLVGLLIIAALVLMALDLLGILDLMARARGSMGQPRAGGPTAGGD